MIEKIEIRTLCIASEAMLFVYLIVFLALYQNPFAKTSQSEAINCITLNHEDSPDIVTRRIHLAYTLQRGMWLMEEYPKINIQHIESSDIHTRLLGYFQLYVLAISNVLLCGALLTSRPNPFFIHIVVAIASLIPGHVFFNYPLIWKTTCDDPTMLPVPYMNCVIDHEDRIIDLIVANSSTRDCVLGDPIEPPLLFETSIIVLIGLNVILGIIGKYHVIPRIKVLVCKSRRVASV